MTPDDLCAYLLRRLREVQQRLGLPPAAYPSARFADELDSMGTVEFIGLVAADCAVEPEAVEKAAGRRLGSVADLARALQAAGIEPRTALPAPATEPVPSQPPTTAAWLAGASVCLGARRQAAAEIDALLDRPAGWFAGHTGIHTRRLWGEADVLDAAARTARECLARSGSAPEQVVALLATGEAPPVAVGLAAALHARIGLPAGCPALEVGGACNGLVAALYLGQHLLRQGGAVLIVAVESPSRWLEVRPGAQGEVAALFGDGAGACLLTASPSGAARPLRDVVLGGDGHLGHLLRALPRPGGIALEMDGPALAGRAVRQLAATVHDLAARHDIGLGDLQTIVVHGGNGRLPALLARQLGLPEERVHSEAARTGNLGSVSLPVAWVSATDDGSGPVVWAAIAAGLAWGAALFAPAAVRVASYRNLR
jgi:3-oxoacyl-[acyl-carrier-protein] synthase-3